MKKLFCSVIILFLCAVCIGFAMQNQPVGEEYSDYLRIHVRANSNSADDQQVKYEVKDEVVAFITPYVAECVTKERALEVIGGILPEIEKVCDEALISRGKSYRSRAQIRQEKFPTRVYGELTLEEGIYDALIIELGTGEGDNWWCVIYPPLCFTSANASVEYRSAIWEIINKFINKG
ncbi:MAG: stage II sporulation protein R [Candidatus Coproplasma sp.]